MDEDATPLTTVVAHAWQCDHLGHLNVRHYAAIFDDAVFVLWSRHGVGRDDAVVPVTAEIRIGFCAEVAAGTVATVRARVERIGGKSVTLRIEMAEVRTGQLLATCEVVEVFVHRGGGGSAPVPDAVRASLAG